MTGRPRLVELVGPAGLPVTTSTQGPKELLDVNVAASSATVPDPIGVKGADGATIASPSNPLPVEVDKALPAGSAVIGKVSIDQATPGTTNLVAADLTKVAGTPISTGAGAVGTGTPRIAVGQDTTTIAGSAPGTAGTPSAQVLSVQGVSGGTGLPTNIAQYGGTNVVTGGVAGMPAVGGTVASDQPVTANPLLNGGRASTATPSAVSADGDAVAAWFSRTGVAVIGRQTTSGALGDGASNTGSLPLDAFGNVELLFNFPYYLNGNGTPSWDRVRGDVTGAWVQGNLAIDAPATAKPLLDGGRASAATPTAVSTDGDVQALWLTKNGAIVIGGSAGTTAATWRVSTVGVGSTGSTATPADGRTNAGNFAFLGTQGADAPQVVANYNYNGTTWDLLRGDTVGVWVQGNLAIDAPVTAKPLLGGGRASLAIPTAVSADGDAQAMWLNLNGAVKTELAPAATSQILAGSQAFTSTTAATTVVTIAAGKTWRGWVVVVCDAANEAAATPAGQALGVVTTAGTNVTPAAGTYLECEARCGGNAATGAVGSQGANNAMIEMEVTAPVGNSVTIKCTSTNVGSNSRVSCSAFGRYLN